MLSDKNPEKIKKMFDEISSKYDLVNNVISFGTHKLIKYLAVRALGVFPKANVLDLCCGTGDFVRFINKIEPSSKVIGVDFSQEMIKLAKINNPKGVFVQADCTELPFGDGEFDFVTMGFGLRNIENRSQAIKEIMRVLASGGKFLHVDFGYHNIFWSIFDFVISPLIRLLGKDYPHYEYLLKSKQEFPEPDELVKEFEYCGLRKVRIIKYFWGIISAQIMVKN